MRHGWQLESTASSQSFGSHVLDAANLAGAEHLVLSENMRYRSKCLWLQAIFSFDHEGGLIDHRRYVDLVVKLAWRRQGHLALDADTMPAVLREKAEQVLENFKAIANFIGTWNAELRSHIEVSTEFLNQLWNKFDRFDLRCMQATSALLDRIIRFRMGD